MTERQVTQEQRRLAELRCYDVLDTPAEPQFDDLAALAGDLCDTPVAAVTLVDSDRVWLKAKVGVPVTELPRDGAFCDAVARGNDDLLQVPDALLDTRFDRSVLVAGPAGIRFYAGVPLTTVTGQRLGALCVLDSVPRQLDARQVDALKALGRQVVSLLELRRTARDNARLYADARHAERRARHDATHDALTGLPNRGLIAEQLAALIDRSADNAADDYAVLFLDLDQFKVINDSLGHAAGDLLLNTVASRLGTALAGVAEVADSHTIGRFGGDEFVVLLSRVPGLDVIGKIVQRLLAAVAKPFYFGGKVTHPGTSIGIVIGGGHYAQAEDLLRDADAALYQAKSTGRGRYVVFDSKMHERALHRLTIEADLRLAVQKNELLLHYQPVVSLADHRPIGFEALVRWNHDGKLVGPGDFIPIAEETGLIVPIGRWVLAEAVRRAAAWKRRHPGLAPFKMAVNLSRRQLSDPDLIPFVRQLLTDCAFDPAMLMLEITESVVMDQADEARRILNELRALGVRLAMDDFGTGYSSLSCLHEFDLDVLKVDRSFIANLGQGREATVLRAVVQLAHGLGMKVVAEGIETTQQSAFLQSTRCDYGQGFLFSRPIEADAAEAFLTRPAKAIAG